MALFRKLFYRKPPDGLLEICERVYVFDCCFTTDALEEQDYKGYVGGIVTQLRENYPDASILAFNFREGDTQSQIGNVLTEYDMTIIEYPRHYEGCPLLPMEVIHHFLRSSESWFSLGLQNLLLMHCERGGWPVLAFMLAALLIYRKHYSGELKTLDMVYKQAPRELLQLLSPLNPMPSQLRYLLYVSRRNVATEWPPLDRALSLDCVIIRMIPNFDGEGGCRPIFRIYGQDPLVSDRSPKVLFSTRKKSRSVRHYKQAECEIVKVDINCLIQGDVVLECISLYDDLEREVMMFRVMFNTAFIRSNILMLNRDEIDVLWDAKDLFPKDFRAEVLFSEMDTAASMVPMDHSCFEEKDGLPVEAFAKVQEIFSSVDWLVPKGDAAVEALQHALSNTAIEAYSLAEKSQVNESLAALEVKSLEKSSTSLIRHSSLNELTDSNTPQIGMDKDVLPSEAETLYPKSLHSALEDTISLQNLSPSLPLLIPEIPSASTPLMDDSITKPASSSEVIVKTSIMVDEAKSTGVGHLSPSTTLSSNLTDIQVTEGGSPSPHLSSPITDATLNTTPPTPSLPNPNVAFVNENSASICGPSPSEPLPPTSSFKENLECGIRPSPPPASTPYLTDEPAANRLASSLLPSPLSPGPHESSSIKDGPPLLAPPPPHPPPPLPPSSPPLKDHYTPEVLPPLTPPLKDISVARPVPCPPPPPRPPIDSFSGGEPTPYSGNDASSLTPPLRDSLVTGPVPGPPSSPPQHPKERLVEEGPHFPQPPSGQTATNSQTFSPPHFPPPLTSPTVSSPSVPAAPLPPGSPSTKSSPHAPSAPTPLPGSPSTRSSPSVPLAPPPPPGSPSTKSSPSVPSAPPPPDSPSTRSSHFVPSAPPPPPPPDSPSTRSSPSVPLEPPPPHGSLSTRSSSSVPSEPPPPHGSPSTRSSPSVPSAPPPPGSPSTSGSPSVPSAPPPPPDSPSTRNSPSVPSEPPPPHGSPSTRSSLSVPSAPPPPGSPSTSGSPSVPSAPPPPGSPSTSGSPSVPSAPPPPPGSPSTRISPSVPSAPPAPPGSPSSRISPSVPSAPPGLPGSPSPPPPSNPPPGTKGKSLLSRTITSKNSQTKKLKPLHWLKISRAVSGSMWAEAQKSGEASRAPEIDMSELETLFSAAAPNSDQGGSGRKTGSRASMSKPEKVQLIEHRRAYNCEIMLSKVKIPLHDMLSSVLALEDSALDVDQVDNLIKFCPTKEEMELLKGYQGDTDKLGKCEQFFLELMQVPRTEQKLRVYSFKIQFCSQVSDLRNNLTVVNSAVDQIRGSSQLKRIMQTILSLGNALNQGTARGSAVGFRLDSLLKLTETRARNNKMTLMHYLCKVLSDKLPELLYFWKDLSSLELASKIQLKFLAEEMQAVNKGLEKVVQELSMAESDGPVSDQFCKALKEFLCYSESEVRSLASLYAGVGRNVDSLILYFGEDPARCPFEQVISTLLNFVRMFKQSHEENCKQIEFEKKKAEKEAAERMKAEKELVEKMKAEEEASEKTKRNDPDTGHLLQSEVKSIE